MTDTLAPPRADQPASPRRRLPSVPGPLETAVLAGRRLRRMSTALLLLFAMAAASVVATFVPQEPVIGPTVEAWRAGTAGPGRLVAGVLDAGGIFDVFGSWWFTTLTVALFVSLTGCLLPRYRAFVRVARRPPAAGRNLERLSAFAETVTPLPPDQALAVARRVLRRRRYRVLAVAAEVSPTGVAQLAAERGHAREGGSLVFHTAFYLLMVGILIGQAFGFTGQVNVVEDSPGFVDTPLSYGTRKPGRFWSTGDHRGFHVGLDDFTATYHPNQTPADFVSRVTLTDRQGATVQRDVRVNEPITFQGMKLYQARFGMAPRLILRDAATGREVFSDAVALREAGRNTWAGATKVTMGGDRADGSGPAPQIALDLALLPDAQVGDAGPVAGSPEATNPVLFANLYVDDDLGLTSPVPIDEIARTWTPEQRADSVVLREGQQVALAGGALTLEFAEVKMWSGFQVSHAPGRWVLLAAGTLVLAGLVPSLYAYRRRVWVEARPADDGRTAVVLAGVALQRSSTFAEEFPQISADLRRALSD